MATPNCLRAVGIGAGQAIGGLGDAQRLPGDAQTGAVHQAEDVANEAQLTLADENGRGIIEDQFAGGRTVDAELLFEVANLDARAAVGQQHGKAAAIAGPRFGSRQHQQHVAAAVGDETLDAGQAPLAIIILPGAKLNGLQVRTGIGLGQHHGAGHFAAGELRQVLGLDLVIGERIDRLSDPLQVRRGSSATHRRG